MVREALLLVDRCRARPGGDFGGGDVIIDAPADVLGPGLAAVAPPGIGFAGGLRMQPPIDVDPADFVEHAREPGALFRQKAAEYMVRHPDHPNDFADSEKPIASDHEFLPA